MASLSFPASPAWAMTYGHLQVDMTYRGHGHLQNTGSEAPELIEVGPSGEELVIGLPAGLRQIPTARQGLMHIPGRFLCGVDESHLATRHRPDERL